jgi:YD repeat-containing protein
METQLTYGKYDKFGNNISLSIKDAFNIVYIWSYNGQYPIAEIKNATYNEVQNAAPSFLNNIENSSNPSDSSLNYLSDRLRNNLPNAQVTTYTYKPLVGMTSMTDPRGVTTFYEYDSFNRLQFIKNKDGIIIQSFDYKYKQH